MSSRRLSPPARLIAQEKTLRKRNTADQLRGAEIEGLRVRTFSDSWRLKQAAANARRFFRTDRKALEKAVAEEVRATGACRIANGFRRMNRNNPHSERLRAAMEELIVPYNEAVNPRNKSQWLRARKRVGEITRRMLVLVEEAKRR